VFSDTNQNDLSTQWAQLYWQTNSVCLTVIAACLDFARKSSEWQTLIKICSSKGTLMYGVSLMWWGRRCYELYVILNSVANNMKKTTGLKINDIYGVCVCVCVYEIK
jgi:hypothetical protein